MTSKRTSRPQHMHAASLKSKPKEISSSVPVKSPLAEFCHISGSLQSVDALIEDALLEDEGGDVDAQLICGSLVGGKLAFQSFETFHGDDARRRNVRDETGEKDCRNDAAGGETECDGAANDSNVSSEASEETAASVSFNDDHSPTFNLNDAIHDNAQGSRDTDAEVPTPVMARISQSASLATVSDATLGSPTSSPSRVKGALLTAQLLSASPHPEPLAFELIEARIFREGPANRRFVLYTIVVKKDLAKRGDTLTSPDGRSLTLEKRFSDFDNLHKSLKRSVPSSMAAISIPPKRLFKNFDAKTIAERSRAFEQYLTHVSGVDALRRSDSFVDFFYGADLRAAFDCLYRQNYVAALPSLHRCLDVATMIVGGAHRHSFLALCALAAVYNELEEESAARTHAEAAVEWLRRCEGWTDYVTHDPAASTKTDPKNQEISPWERRRGTSNHHRKNCETTEDDSSSSSSLSSSSSGYHSSSVFHSGFTYNILTTPLIELTIRLRWKLGMDKRELEEILAKIEKDPGFVKERKRTLLLAVTCLRPDF